VLHVFVIQNDALRSLPLTTRQTLQEISMFVGTATPADNEFFVRKDRFGPTPPDYPQALQDVLARLDTLLGIDSPTLEPEDTDGCEPSSPGGD
jgi:hypothetical protein